MRFPAPWWRTQPSSELSCLPLRSRCELCLQPDADMCHAKAASKIRLDGTPAARVLSNHPNWGSGSARSLTNPQVLKALLVLGSLMYGLKPVPSKLNHYRRGKFIARRVP